jgi:hypothetical protein
VWSGGEFYLAAANTHGALLVAIVGLNQVLVAKDIIHLVRN